MSLTHNIQIAFRCSVCGENTIENALSANRRMSELVTGVCKECYQEAQAAVIGLVVDSVTDPYARNVIDFGVVNMYRPPVTRSNNWLGMFIAVVLVIGAAVALGRCAG